MRLAAAPGGRGPKSTARRVNWSAASLLKSAAQATELLNATEPLPWWDPRQYLKDLLSRNVGLWTFIRYMLISWFNALMRRRLRRQAYPSIRGLAGDKTPAAALNLQPGELVTVRSKAEIMRTINAGQRNRGLWFDAEMVPYCGHSFRVLRRVQRLIDEKTGHMLSLPSDCLILDDVTCGGCLSRNRLFCPRSLYPYWREIWLKRAHEGAPAAD